jgi:hypothetical protein
MRFHGSPGSDAASSSISISISRRICFEPRPDQARQRRSFEKSGHENQHA